MVLSKYSILLKLKQITINESDQIITSNLEHINIKYFNMMWKFNKKILFS